jgi:hypothetical protein
MTTTIPAKRRLARHQPAQQPVEQRLGSDHGRCLKWLHCESA